MNPKNERVLTGNSNNLRVLLVLKRQVIKSYITTKMRTECSCSDRHYDGGHRESIRIVPSDIWREMGKCYCSQVLRSVFAWKTVTQWGTCEYYCHYTTVITSRQATALNGNSFSTPQNSLTVSSSSSTLKKQYKMLFTTVCTLLSPATCTKFAGVTHSVNSAQ